MKKIIFLSCMVIIVEGFSQNKWSKPSLSDLDFNQSIEKISKNNSSNEFIDSLKNIIISCVINSDNFKNNLTIRTRLTSKTIKELVSQIEINNDWSNNKFNKLISKEFKKIYCLDQSVREKLRKGDTFPNRNEVLKMIEKVDSQNLKQIDSIIKLYGFPKKDWIGKEYMSFITIYYMHNQDNFLKNYHIFKEADKLGFMPNGLFVSTIEQAFRLLNCQEQEIKMYYCRNFKNESIPCDSCNFWFAKKYNKCKCNDVK
jgi:hypothetical protein